MKTQDGQYNTADARAYLYMCNPNIFISTQNTTTSETTLRAFPNPSSHHITLDANDITGATLTVFDALGRKCQTEILTENRSFDIQNLPKGVYFGEILTNEKKAYRFKFIKNE